MRRWYISLIIVGIIALLCFWLLPAKNKSDPVNKASTPAKKDPPPPLSLETLLIHKLEKMVAEGSKGAYHLSVEGVDISVVPSKVVLKNIVLMPDTLTIKQSGTSYTQLFKVSLPYLSIEGIGPGDLLDRKNINLDSIHITHPVIEVYQYPSSDKKAIADSATLYQRISQEINSLAVKHIFIEHAHIISHPAGSKNKQIQFKDVSIRLNDLLIDTTTQYDRQRFLFAKDAHIRLKDFETKTDDHLYTFKIAAVAIDAIEKNMRISNVALVPLYNKQQFQKHITAMKERYDVLIPKVEFKNIDWWSFTNRESLIASEATIRNQKVSIYLDRSLPEGKAEIDNYPHQVLMQLPLQVNIHQVDVKNADVIYQEFSPESGKTGTLHFEKINGRLLHVTNIPAAIKKRNQLTAHFTTQFMGTPAQVDFTFYLSRYKKGDFSTSVQYGSLQITKLNTLTEPFALIKAKSGTIQKLRATVYGDNYAGHGKVLLLYDDYKMILLKKDKDSKNGVKKKRITGFLANVFVIKNANPSKGEPPRNPSCNFKRDPHGSFFNLIWKTMLVGILKTIGADPKLASEK